MSCPHGNPEGECEECQILDDHWNKGYEAGRKAGVLAIEQAITNPENQPSQFGTVTLEYHQRELSAAQAEIERLREDAERLNWVDDNFRNGSIRWLPRAFEKFHIKHNEVIYSGASFRAAIDKARRA